MALPPTIPTSFVPKQPLSAGARKATAGTNYLLIGAGIIFGIAVLAAAGVFGYKTYLENARDTKAAQLVQAQQEIDMDTIENFIRLRDRLRSTETIIGQHVLLSRFFEVLETRALQSVQLKTLSLKVNEDRSAEIEAGGVAASFNALAAQSASFAEEKRIKSAIFSDITPDKDGVIQFTLNANLDPRLITNAGGEAFVSPSEAAAPPAPAAPSQSTPTSTPVAPVKAAPQASTSPTTL